MVGCPTIAKGTKKWNKAARRVTNEKTTQEDRKMALSNAWQVMHLEVYKSI